MALGAQPRAGLLCPVWVKVRPSGSCQSHTSHSCDRCGNHSRQESRGMHPQEEKPGRRRGGEEGELGPPQQRWPRLRGCVSLCVWFAGNLQGSASDSGWDLCADGPPVLTVVVAVLSQRTDRGQREENSGDDFRMSWLRHVMLFVPASPWNSLATG